MRQIRRLRLSMTTAQDTAYQTYRDRLLHPLRHHGAGLSWCLQPHERVRRGRDGFIPWHHAALHPVGRGRLLFNTVMPSPDTMQMSYSMLFLTGFCIRMPKERSVVSSVSARLGLFIPAESDHIKFYLRNLSMYLQTLNRRGPCPLQTNPYLA